ncbi:SnoaL-like domain-containing protein [Copromyces sp. CBS 386.78]|nr:SnoaL-like domain-containing protein [Copromyces sp. CBS 386.78]
MECVGNPGRDLCTASDEAEIRKTHHKYGYYLDKCLYNQVVNLFSNRPDTLVEFLGSRYLGKAGTFVKGRNGPIHCFLLDHIMMQDIVDVSSSGDHAWCRMRALMQAGTHNSIEKDFSMGHRQWWEGGLYENEYVKEDGVWKLCRYRYFPFWHADFETGWSKTKPNYVPWPARRFPEDPTGPDEILERKMLWPDTRVVMFHYPHPVTGERINSGHLRAPKYGEGVQEGCKEPLVLELPGGKKWEGAEERESKKGEKVLPELVQAKLEE